MSGKMILYKLVVLGDGGVGKVGLSRHSPSPLGHESSRTALDRFNDTALPPAFRRDVSSSPPEAPVAIANCNSPATTRQLKTPTANKSS